MVFYEDKNALYETVKDKVEGACLFCATVFGAKESVKECKVNLVDEFEQHISVKNLFFKKLHLLSLLAVSMDRSNQTENAY